MQKKILKHFHIFLFNISLIVSVSFFCSNTFSSEVITIGRQTQPEVEIDLRFLENLPRLSLSPNIVIHTNENENKKGSRNNRVKEKTSKRENKVGKSSKPTLSSSVPNRVAPTKNRKTRLPKKPKFDLSTAPKKQSLNRVTRIKAPKKPHLNENKRVIPKTTKKKLNPATKRNNLAVVLPVEKQDSKSVKTAANGVNVRLIFKSKKIKLSSTEAYKLNKLYQQIINDKNNYIQLLAYASSSTSTNSSSARRLSLLRALTVRNLLIQKGVSSNRMSVRALGDKFESGAPNRVDVIITAR